MKTFPLVPFNLLEIHAQHKSGTVRRLFTHSTTPYGTTLVLRIDVGRWLSSWRFAAAMYVLIIIRYLKCSGSGDNTKCEE